METDNWLPVGVHCLLGMVCPTRSVCPTRMILHPKGTSILAVTFVASICDHITLDRSEKASGMLWATLWCAVRGSRWDI